MGQEAHAKLQGLWEFYSGKSGIGRMVQTSFLFYGGITTFMLTFFAIRFNVFDGTLGRTLVGNLAYIGFTQIPGGEIMFWVYQILAVALLAAASMTAFQDLQATEWRDVAIGEIPEIIVYRDERGTFTRSVTIAFIVTIIIMFLVKRKDLGGCAILWRWRIHADHGHGLGHPQAHSCNTYTGRSARWGSIGRWICSCAFRHCFRRANCGQMAGRRLDGTDFLQHTGHCRQPAMLISPVGVRDPKQIHRIVREKARVQGAMASIVEWQSLRMQEYRYSIRD